MEIGDLVMVIVDNPDGSNDFTRGNIGVITNIQHFDNGSDDYTVHTPFSDYLYGIDQIRQITDEEARLALYNLLVK